MAKEKARMSSSHLIYLASPPSVCLCVSRLSSHLSVRLPFRLWSSVSRFLEPHPAGHEGCSRRGRSIHWAPSTASHVLCQVPHMRAIYLNNQSHIKFWYGPSQVLGPLAVAYFRGPNSMKAKCRDAQKCILWSVEGLPMHWMPKTFSHVLCQVPVTD